MGLLERNSARGLDRWDIVQLRDACYYGIRTLQLSSFVFEQANYNDTPENVAC